MHPLLKKILDPPLYTSKRFCVCALTLTDENWRAEKLIGENWSALWKGACGQSTNDWSASYGDLLSRAKMTTLYNRKLQDIAIFMFKIKHGMLLSSVTELFNTSHTNYNLRNADFRQECFNTTKYGKHSLRHFGPLLWSKVNRELRSAPTLSNFKKGIKKTDIASSIDDSCNDCVLCKSSH